MNRYAIGTGLLLLIMAATASAEAIYISDRLEAPLRRGEGTQYKVLRMLKSGEALELLERRADTGYTRVRTRSGTEGYVLTRYLMPGPAARERVDQLNKDNQELRGIIVDLENRISELEIQNRDQGTQITQLSDEKSDLDTELSGIREATADVIAIKRNNQTLSDEVALLTEEKNRLQVDNENYRSRTKQDWFVRGAGVVLLGVLIGLVLPKLRRRKRWSDI